MHGCECDCECVSVWMWWLSECVWVCVSVCARNRTFLEDSRMNHTTRAYVPQLCESMCTSTHDTQKLEASRTDLLNFGECEGISAVQSTCNASITISIANKITVLRVTFQRWEYWMQEDLCSCVHADLSRIFESSITMVTPHFLHIRARIQCGNRDMALSQLEEG